MKYRAEIDGLRAIAMLPVIFFHAGLSLFSGGYVGVDVFFVISGFLITRIIIEELEQQQFSIVTFIEDGELIYSDGGHLTEFGASFALQGLAEALREH